MEKHEETLRDDQLDGKLKERGKKLGSVRMT
jgi:hypothetical protein